VKILEFAVAGAFVALGLRSFVHWARQPFTGRDAVDHLLFALYVMSRVGIWFAFAGVFLIFAFTRTEGRAFVDDVGQYRWYLGVILVLAVLQVVAGWFLARRGPVDVPDRDDAP
jgi:hypothetical protein